MIKITKYNSLLKQEWDYLVETAKNNLFLFKRDYMEYHKDRFSDYSLMFYKDDNLIALLPANIKNNIIYSHNGLTYGGLIYNTKITTTTIIEIFDYLIQFLKQENIEYLYYKAVPYIFNTYPAQEDLYALFRFKAELYRVDAFSAIDLHNMIGLSHGKRNAINKSAKYNLHIEESTDFNTFFNDIVNKQLQNKYKVVATHTPEEMAHLKNQFPQNIVFYKVSYNNEMVAGAVLYKFSGIVHTQYIFSNDTGKKVKAVEFLVYFLIKKYQTTNRWFTFGISTEQDGLILNSGLLSFKEEFGSRTIVCQHFKLPIQ
ncbi:MAG: GNAT family N-acetyltransferase [Alphaproteobacteria bacterium]|nr:GNAT family N-acetyltransferase [Alphaproteobacteria bacterium]OJV16067.1 MAG: hypothetical protein BGO27_04395 [Alphaproteobacteria bacterium 33-17]